MMDGWRIGWKPCGRDNIQWHKSVFFNSGDKLWWADQGTDQIGTCDKKDGGNWRVLRNNTSPMMHMKIYDEDVQKGKKSYSWEAILYSLLFEFWGAFKSQKFRK